MNIITIVSDTLRYDCVAFHGRAPYRWDLARPIQTPHLDAFARQAVVFDRAYAGSFPTLPMRTDLFTAQLCFPFRGWGPLPTDKPVLAELLSGAGYVSMAIFDTPHLVRDGRRYERGFDAWHWNRGQEGDNAITDDIHVEMRCDPAKQRLPERHLRCHLKWRTVHWQCEEDYFVAHTVRDACCWLERNYTHERFYLHVDVFDPHEPWDPPPYYTDLYDPGYTGEVVDHPLYAHQDFLSPEELRHCRALYAGEVTLVDTWLGRLFETIDHLGLWTNTAVFLLSDHGHYIGDHDRVGKSGTDADGPWPFYEEVSHIVMMARIPGAIPRRVQWLAQPVDVLPTILDLAELPHPEGLHGQSLLPILKGGTLPARRVVVTSSALSADPQEPVCSAITDGTWTLQYRGPNYPAELHHLNRDPAQRDELYATHRQEAERLHRAYLDLLRRVGTDPQKIALRSQLPSA